LASTGPVALLGAAACGVALVGAGADSVRWALQPTIPHSSVKPAKNEKPWAMIAQSIAHLEARTRPARSSWAARVRRFRNGAQCALLNE
jgi:hypothetical protein